MCSRSSVIARFNFHAHLPTHSPLLLLLIENCDWSSDRLCIQQSIIYIWPEQSTEICQLFQYGAEYVLCTRCMCAVSVKRINILVFGVISSLTYQLPSNLEHQKACRSPKYPHSWMNSALENESLSRGIYCQQYSCLAGLVHRTYGYNWNHADVGKHTCELQHVNWWTAEVVCRLWTYIIIMYYNLSR